MEEKPKKKYNFEDKEFASEAGKKSKRGPGIANKIRAEISKNTQEGTDLIGEMISIARDQGHAKQFDAIKQLLKYIDPTLDVKVSAELDNSEKKRVISFGTSESTDKEEEFDAEK